MAIIGGYIIAGTLGYVVYAFEKTVNLSAEVPSNPCNQCISICHLQK
jgi:hypothetical protein